MKIAIFGSTGLLGKALAKKYKENELKLFSRTEIDNKQKFVIDYMNIENELENFFDNWKPDIIINTIAIVDLKYCEENLKEAKYVNSIIAESLAKVAKKYNAYFIHISTDHFFSDSLKYHNENASVKILNNYAETKFEAEKKVLQEYKKSLIVRTNILGFRYSKKKSFFEWLLFALENKEEISLFNDFVTSPISVNLLSNILLLCKKSNLSGIYNISSSEAIDKYSFGYKVAKRFNLSFENVKMRKTIQSDIKRAITLGLDVSKIEKALNIKMPTIDETIESLYIEYKKGKE
ncbi:SDR family oxidoreductase [Halarcobacter sp.]|uniref:SDR family oxidoreductase n=1 Tax=Halarcobacter sp. TaxID=2321133 RepID=UPI003B00509F